MNQINEINRATLENRENGSSTAYDTLSPSCLGGHLSLSYAALFSSLPSLWSSSALGGSQHPPLSTRERLDRRTFRRRVGHHETIDRIMVGKTPTAVSRPLHQSRKQRIRDRTGRAAGRKSPDCRNVSSHDAAGGR